MDNFTKTIVDAIEAKHASSGNLNDAFATVMDSVEVVIKCYAIKHGWSKWGDGEWREETACSLCGSSVPGICEHAKNPNRVVLRGMAAVEAQHAAESRFQNWLVDADSKKDALKKNKNGESVFESEEIEVLALGEPEVSKDED